MLDLELIIFAIIAVLVLGRLYVVLGRKTGAEPPPHIVRENAVRRNRQEERPEEKDGKTSAVVLGGDLVREATEGLQEISRRSPGFSPQGFLEGGRAAYGMIVNAFAQGDLDALRKLLTREVFFNYREEIRNRKGGSPEPFSLMRLRSAEIASAELTEDGLASISTRFEAELSNGERQKLVKEVWTFQRLLSSRDPNWLLAGVEVGS